MEIDQTNTRYRFTVEEITSLPTATVEDLVATSPSTYGAFLRGSRQNETKVLVDGIDITNQYAGWYNQTFGPGGTFTVYNAVLPFEEAQTPGLMRMTQSSLQAAFLQTIPVLPEG